MFCLVYINTVSSLYIIHIDNIVIYVCINHKKWDPWKKSEYETESIIQNLSEFISKI